MRKILIVSPKYGKKYLIIDNKLYNKAIKFKWCVSRDYNTFYAKTNIKVNNKYKTVSFHKLFFKTKKGLVLDHISGNGLDNRKSNLRICTSSENAKNKRLSKTNKYGHKGISYLKRINKYQVEVCNNYKRYYIGVYKTIKQAYKAYCEAAKKYHGEFARLK